MGTIIWAVVAVFAIAIISGLIAGIKSDSYMRNNAIDYARITTSEPNEYSTYEVHYKNGEVKLYRAHRTSTTAKYLMHYLK